LSGGAEAHQPTAILRLAIDAVPEALVAKSNAVKNFRIYIRVRDIIMDIQRDERLGDLRVAGSYPFKAIE